MKPKTPATPQGGDPGIAAIAAAANPAPEPAPGAPNDRSAPGPGAQPIDWKQEARDLWRIFAMLSLRFPSLERIFTEQAIDHLAAAWAPVLERHQIDMGKLMIYFVAATATLPVLGETYKAIQHDRAIERARAPAAATPPAASDAPGASGAPPDAAQLHKLA